MPDYADATNVKPVQSLKNLVDSSGGTESDTGTIVGGNGIFSIAFQIALASIADGDIVTDYPLGAILGQSWQVIDITATAGTPASTANKLSTIHPEIGATPVTGGALALTTANQNAVGETVRGSSITGANTGTSSDTLSLVAASTTAFVEGTTTIQVWIKPAGINNNLATLAGQLA